MAEVVQANWILLVVALAIGLAVAWWIFAANRKTSVTRDETVDEAGPAKRNQALIDAAPAASATRPAAPRAPAARQDGAIATADGEAAQVAASPTKPVSQPAQAAPAPPPLDGRGDDLTLIKGLGPKLQAQLQEMGIFSFAQIAAWNDADIDRIDGQLGRFQGRIRRDNWVEQAGLLKSGDRGAYEDRFGRT